MKRSGIILGLCIALASTLSGPAWAYPIELNTVEVRYENLQTVTPALTNSNGSQRVYTEYWFNADYFTDEVEAFCVQNQQYYPNHTYSLYLADPTPYSDQDTWDIVLAIAIEGFYHRSFSRAAYQIAIWNVLYDVNVANNDSLQKDVDFIVGSYSSPFQTGLTGNPMLLAVSATSQNYLLKSPAPVPEPATVLLLGLGLLGVFALRRRTFLRT